MMMPLTVLNVLVYLPAVSFSLQHGFPRCIMHSDSASCRGQTMGNGSPIKCNCSSRVAVLVWTGCMGESLKYCKCMFLELWLISVKSFDFSPPPPYSTMSLCATQQRGCGWLGAADGRWKRECRAHWWQQQSSAWHWFRRKVNPV